MVAPKEILDLIRLSGNDFHAKVARWLIKNNWHVVVSPYYMDQTQSKAREIDLVAEKLWSTTDTFGHEAGSVAVRLFIECKFVAADSVFWFADKDRASALALLTANGLFPPNNSFTNKHHYISHSPRVAKLFSSGSNKNSENEPFYKALNQVLNAMVSMRGRPLTVPKPRKSQLDVKGIIELPVVVCSSFDRAYFVDFDSDSKPESISQNFQLEVRYAYVDKREQQRDDYFLLDFVEFGKLAEFMICVDEDAKAAALLASG